mgnify:CR=1 FL=1
MNTYKNLTDENFRRLTGIKRKTFDKMMEILKEKETEKNRRGARPNKISLEERLLMWFEYMREYGTYFHIATKHKISESTCFRNCVWIENVLIKSKEFKLPSKKEFANNLDIEIVVVDASESPIQRPKKNKKDTTPERKRGILSRRK